MFQIVANLITPCTLGFLVQLEALTCDLPTPKQNQTLDYINSPAHCCITQPPAPSGKSARVIA